MNHITQEILDYVDARSRAASQRWDAASARWVATLIRLTDHDEVKEDGSRLPFRLIGLHFLPTIRDGQVHLGPTSVRVQWGCHKANPEATGLETRPWDFEGKAARIAAGQYPWDSGLYLKVGKTYTMSRRMFAGILIQLQSLSEVGLIKPTRVEWITTREIR